MSKIEFDVTQFRADFPAFSNPATYPDATLQGYWSAAICYISDDDYGYLTGDCRRRAINLMTAHLCVISELAQLGSTASQGQTAAQIQSSSIDKISVSTTPPPNRDQYEWWLGLTPYGSQLAALLSSKISGGFYIGGSPEKSAFRKVCGLF